MTSCIFCQKEDDPNGMKIYNTCSVSNGERCAPCAEYITLDAEIREMQKSLERKLCRRRQVRENINLQHNTMVARFPDEITTSIFELAATLDNDPEAQSAAPLRKGEIYAPLFLGAVCRAWRDVAWGMPRLWTFININIPTLEDAPERLHITKQWLARTGNHLPLSIHLRTYDSYGPDEVIQSDEERDRLWDEVAVNFEPLAKLLGRHSQRWQVFCATCPPQVMNYLCDHYQGAPILRTLQLSATRPGLDEFTSDIFGFGCNAVPQPKSILLSNISPKMVTIDWDQVTDLTTMSISVDDIVDLLPCMSNLGTLVLSDMERLWDEAVPSPTTHSKIHSLRLKVSSRESLYFLAGLTLPALKNLSIDCQGNTSVLRQVTLLIRRSSCTVVSMSLFVLPDDRPSIAELIGCLNSLKYLEIRELHTRIDCHFLQALNHLRNNSEVPFLQKLRRLTYVIRPDDDLLVDPLIGHIVDPKWTQRFPEWRTLTILRDPNPSFFKDRKNTKYVLESIPRKARERLLELIDSGKEFFFPFKITRSEVLKTLNTSYMTSTMKDVVALQGLMSVFDNLS